MIPGGPENTGAKYCKSNVTKSLRPAVGNAVPKSAFRRNASLGF
jgi:hypothetical protein